MPGNWKMKTSVETIFKISTWKVLSLLKYVYVKKLTHYCKTVETRVDPHLLSPLVSILIANTTRCTGPVRIATGFEGETKCKF